MFTQHPSVALNNLFASKPYQGVSPDQARFLFVGLDANYDRNIEQNQVFPKLLEYHRDGAAFWRTYGVHHPFMLPTYSGDGRYYHQSFARIGFSPEHANLVSLVELLHVPTVGRNKLAPEDLSTSHLEFLNSAILNGSAEHVFVSAGVARLMRASMVFPWLPRTAPAKTGVLSSLYSQPGKTVYSHLHFSVYGKFQQQKTVEAAAIFELLQKPPRGA